MKYSATLIHGPAQSEGWGGGPVSTAATARRAPTARAKHQ